jgi:hypothetical protein
MEPAIAPNGAIWMTTVHHDGDPGTGPQVDPLTGAVYLRRAGGLPSLLWQGTDRHCR